MKKIFLYISVLAAAVACNKAVIDNDPSGVDPVTGIKMITEIISGQRGSATKATISNDDTPAFAWTIGDNIAVHVSNGSYVLTSGDGGASTNAATANFTVAYPDGTSRDAFAVYPSTIVTASAANYGQSGHTLDVTLPSSYALAQVSGTTTPCPMIATNSPGAGLVFYQLCGLLRLTVNSIPPSTKRLEIDFGGKKVCGSFSIASPTPGTSSITTSADDANDVIKVFKEGPTEDVTLNGSAWLDELVLNIPLPTGKYTNVTITAYDALTDGNATFTITQPFTYTASREYGTKRTVSVPVISIGANKRVVFSPGNLIKTDNTYAVGSGNESYEFETTPFNTNGGSLGYADGIPTSTSARGYYTWNEATSLGPLTINGISGWRILTLAEWQYIMGARAMKYGIAKWFLIKSTANKYGLLIPPDNATTSDVSGLTDGMVINTNVDIDAYLTKGFVFLPAEGCRYGTSWSYTNDEGYYWSTTAKDQTYGYEWSFDCVTNVIVNSYNQLKKSYYCSIRLVREIN